MAAGAHGNKYTFTSGGTVSLTTAAGRTVEFFLANTAVRCPRENVGEVYVVIDGQDAGLLYAGDAIGIDLANRWFGSNQVGFRGTTNDKIHLMWFD